MGSMESVNFAKTPKYRKDFTLAQEEYLAKLQWKVFFFFFFAFTGHMAYVKSHMIILQRTIYLIFL